MTNSTIPVIDFSHYNEQKTAVAKAIKAACIQHGFFYIAGHGVDEHLQKEIEQLAAAFFALPLEEKNTIAMHKAGKAWRGFFPVNAELTSGKPDLKEGIYFGMELPDTDPRVQAGWPLHGANLFPEQLPAFKQVVLNYIDAVTQVGQLVMQAVSVSLGLDEYYFFEKYNQDPTILFRIFHYPPQQHAADQWGVGEHTDYGLLTILKQDMVGGLQVKSGNDWIDAPPIPNTFICNIGDMLERMTGGLYRSTPHRVLNLSGKERYSFPLFFDPGFSTHIEKIATAAIRENQHERWDGASVHTISGTYGEYLLSKVGKVFPDLKTDVL